MSKQCNSKCVFQKVKRKQRAGRVYRNFQSCLQVTHRIEVLKDLWAGDLCIIGSFKNPEMAARAKYNVHFWNHKKSFVLQQAELTEVEFQWSMFWLWVSLFSLASLPRKPFSYFACCFSSGATTVKVEARPRCSVFKWELAPCLPLILMEGVGEHGVLIACQDL